MLLVLSIPPDLRKPFDSFLASSPAYAGALQGVSFADALERAWQGVSTLDSVIGSAPPDTSVAPLLHAAISKFKSGEKSSSGGEGLDFDGEAARKHLRSAKEIAARMLARFPFPTFMQSSFWAPFIAGLRGAGERIVVPASSMAIVDGGAARTGDALARELAAVQKADAGARSKAESQLRGTPLHDATAMRRAAWLADWSAAAETLPCMVTIADMNTPGVPIVYANATFYKTTGFGPESVIGRNCRFLQGPETSKESIDLLRTSIRDGKLVQCELLNYRKDGSRFRNYLTMKPVFERVPTPARGESGGSTKRMAFYIGVQFEAQALDARPAEAGADGAAAAPPAALPATRILELEALLASLPNDIDQ